MKDERLYTTEEARQELGLKSTARVRQLAIDSKGEIGKKWGRDWMFTEADLAALRERQTRRGPRGKERTTARGPRKEARGDDH